MRERERKGEWGRGCTERGRERWRNRKEEAQRERER